MASGQRIVVVGGLSETEQVLKAVLEPRGLHVERIRDCDFADAGSAAAPPQVVVLHNDERLNYSPSRVRVHQWEDVPHVIIGSAEIDEPCEADAGEFIQKPFHYRELIQAIERVLREPNRGRRAA